MPDRLLKSCLSLLLLAAAGAAGAAWELDDAISPQRLSRDLRLELQLGRPDSELSLRQLRARAEAGDAEAQFGLGLSYQTGQGVERDRPQAARWYRAAAERGYFLAQQSLGEMYRRGEGVPKDDVRAYAWFEIAASLGDADAARSRDTMERSMSSSQLRQARELATRLRATQATAGPDR